MTATPNTAALRLNPWRFHAMIKPNMALAYADSSRVAARKGIWMVLYLRARRDGLMKAYFRRQHFNAATQPTRANEGET